MRDQYPGEKKYIDYGEYLRSKKWRDKKYRIYREFGRKCVACDSKDKVVVHHLTYENIGAELDEDLIVLCWNCHEELHAIYGSRRWDLRDKSYEFITNKQLEREAKALFATL